MKTGIRLPRMIFTSIHSGGGCHEESMLFSRQVCQHYFLGTFLLRPGDLQRASALQLCFEVRELRRLRTEDAPRVFHEIWGSGMVRGPGRARQGVGAEA